MESANSDLTLEKMLCGPKGHISGSSADTYCLNTCNNNFDAYLNLTTQQRIDIAQKRAAVLRKSEWQRWVPVLGFARYFRDLVTSDNTLLTDMYSDKYTAANIAFNVITGIAASTALLSYVVGK